MTKHEELVEAAKKAITAVFSDQSVGQATTRESLKDLRDEIEVMLDTL
jgi:hypothetical protein